MEVGGFLSGGSCPWFWKFWKESAASSSRGEGSSSRPNETGKGKARGKDAKTKEERAEGRMEERIKMSLQMKK